MRSWLALHTLLAILALALGLGARAWATPTSFIDGGRLGARAAVFEDPTGQWSARDVASSASFTTLDRSAANRGHTTSSFWLRFSVENPVLAQETIILELAATPWRVVVYDELGVHELARSGADLPFGDRPVHSANIALRLVLPPASPRTTTTFLVRIESRDTTILDPTLWREDTFLAHVARARLVDGVYYGIILGLATYNLFLAFATRERAYLAYVLFQLTMATANATIDKYTFAYAWPDSPRWALRSEVAFGLWAIAAASLCARLLLDTRRHARNVDTSLRVLGVLAAILGLIATTHDTTPVERVAMTLLSFAGIAMVVAAAAIVARSGSPHGRIFLAAWSLLCIGAVASVLYGNGAIQSLAGYDLLKIGSAFEATLLSIGLAARIRTMQVEQVRVEAELAAERARRVASLSRLVGGIAHELGNPLNFAQGGAEAAAAAIDDTPPGIDAARKGLSFVQRGLARIRRIVEHVRADIGEVEAPATSLVVQNEIDDAMEVLGATLHERGIHVRRDDSTPVRVRARPSDLARIFANILRNASDAMPGGGTIEIVVRVEGKDAVIELRDDGPGVAPTIAETIFDPFFTTRPGVDGGLGLGLYVSRELAMRWGGSLTLASPSGLNGRTGTMRSGATFVVRFPRLTAS